MQQPKSTPDILRRFPMPTKKEAKDIVPHIPIDLQGQKAMLLPNKQILKTVNLCGAKVRIPLQDYEFKQFFGKCQKTKNYCLMHTPPSPQYRLPLKALQLWGQALIQYSHEALIIYGQHRKDPDRWLAVAPSQEVSSTSVDVDSFEKAALVLAKHGYRRVGTLHTHPGDSITGSLTDEKDLWTDFGGIHAIVSHTGRIGWYFSAGGQVWNLKDIKDWAPSSILDPKKLEKNPDCPEGLVTENEDQELDDVFKKKTYAITKSFGHRNYGDWGYNDYGYTGYETSWETWRADQNRKKLIQPNTQQMYRGTWDKKQHAYVYYKQPAGTSVTYAYSNVHPTQYIAGFGHIAVDEKLPADNKTQNTISKPDVCLYEITDTLFEHHNNDLVSTIDDVINELDNQVTQLKTIMEKANLANDPEIKKVIPHLQNISQTIDTAVWGNLGKD